MFLASTPNLITKVFPSLVWRIPTKDKIIYLTFDDGPIPETTPWVLETLQKYSAKATFFCVGDNVRKHHFLYKKLLSLGHSVGNHTYNHLSGWKTDTEGYIQNIMKAEKYIDSNLFRPPHGLLKNSQLQMVKDTYKIIMWDVLSMDYDKKISPEQCLKNVISNVKPGSIVVFHDSIKAWDNLKFALPETLEHFSNLGYTFEAIQQDQLNHSKPSFIEMWFNYSFQRKRA